MKIFNLFKKKEKESKQVIKEEIVGEKPLIPDNCAICFYCKNPIYPHEKRRTFNGKKYHIKCFRKLKAGKF
jgi:hypothetical protein